MTVPVSVVIPCYRHAEVIERAVVSVAMQSARPLELILVNDGGGEAVAKVLMRLQERYGDGWLSIITLPLNVGAGDARNAGWNMAKGEYIAFLDADDAWHPRKLEMQCDYMRTHPDVAVSGHRHRQERTSACWGDYRLTTRAFEVKLPRLLLANQFVTPSAMVRRDLATRFAAGQRHMEDYRLWLSVVAGGGRLVKLDAELACTFKAPFGEAGLSSELISMELGELQTYWAICRETPYLFPMILLLAPYSLAKCLRRYLLLRRWGRR